MALSDTQEAVEPSLAAPPYLKEKQVPHVWSVDGNAHDTPDGRMPEARMLL